MIAGPDFLALQRLLQTRAGMALTSDKLYLVGSRLAPVAQKLGFRSVIDLLAALRERPNETMICAVIEAMMTHESLFFRDGKPFQQISETILPELRRARAARKSLRVWSAACSSGQEAYSLAMLFAEECPAALGWRFEIVGTDISEAILQKARLGQFSAFEVRRGLTDARVARHFQKLPDGSYQIQDALRRMTSFRMHNLIETGVQLGVFDIIFCRNVLIYFDGSTKTRALDVLARQLAPDGVLVLGSADSIAGLTTKLAGVGSERGLYRLASAAAAKAANFA